MQIDNDIVQNCWERIIECVIKTALEINTFSWQWQKRWMLAVCSLDSLKNRPLMSTLLGEFRSESPLYRAIHLRNVIEPEIKKNKVYLFFFLLQTNIVS